MKEIGGYIEFEYYQGLMLHENAIALNCGRNALAYLFMSRGIKKIKLPFFICDSIINICEREGIEKSYYHIGLDFKPAEEIHLDDDEWLYLVNFYGQLTNDIISYYADKYSRIIVDQANAYFQEPIDHIDTIYTCRKWFGVADGAFLYTDEKISEPMEIDVSFDRMRYLLGRLERNASEFYSEYVANNHNFDMEPIKKMSKLTYNLLHGIDYGYVRGKRLANYEFIHRRLGKYNQIDPNIALFMYPFMVKEGQGRNIRKALAKEKIYIPTLWPSVFNISSIDSIEYHMAEDILPLPIDQRYSIADMTYLAERIEEKIV